uniref:Uncharacterized protein n=1 Tax=Anguilla anguilla TaxID=7936 RepID=A0A0E9PQR1_ANGAN
MSACLIILSCRHMIHCWRRRPLLFFCTIIQGSTEQQQVMGEIKEIISPKYFVRNVCAMERLRSP